ncbi:MAG: hypothetical protein ACK4Q5_07685 [Saprospiraceae bacterium]
MKIPAFIFKKKIEAEGLSVKRFACVVEQFGWMWRGGVLEKYGFPVFTFTFAKNQS